MNHIVSKFLFVLGAILIAIGTFQVAKVLLAIFLNYEFFSEVAAINSARLTGEFTADAIIDGLLFAGGYYFLSRSFKKKEEKQELLPTSMVE